MHLTVQVTGKLNLSCELFLCLTSLAELFLPRTLFSLGEFLLFNEELLLHFAEVLLFIEGAFFIC